MTRDTNWLIARFDALSFQEGSGSLAAGWADEAIGHAANKRKASTHRTRGPHP